MGLSFLLSLSFFWFGGHQRCAGLAPRSALRHHAWQCWGTLAGVGAGTQVGCGQGQPATRCPVAPAPCFLFPKKAAGRAVRLSGAPQKLGNGCETDGTSHPGHRELQPLTPGSLRRAGRPAGGARPCIIHRAARPEPSQYCGSSAPSDVQARAGCRRRGALRGAAGARLEPPPRAPARPPVPLSVRPSAQRPRLSSGQTWGAPGGGWGGLGARGAGGHPRGLARAPPGSWDLGSPQGVGRGHRRHRVSCRCCKDS